MINTSFAKPQTLPVLNKPDAQPNKLSPKTVVGLTVLAAAVVLAPEVVLAVAALALLTGCANPMLPSDPLNKTTPPANPEQHGYPYIGGTTYELAGLKPFMGQAPGIKSNEYFSCITSGNTLTVASSGSNTNQYEAIIYAGSIPGLTPYLTPNSINVIRVTNVIVTVTSMNNTNAEGLFAVLIPDCPWSVFNIPRPERVLNVLDAVTNVNKWLYPATPQVPANAYVSNFMLNTPSGVTSGTVFRFSADSASRFGLGFLISQKAGSFSLKVETE